MASDCEPMARERERERERETETETESDNPLVSGTRPVLSAYSVYELLRATSENN
jgi:hypothetical protein